MVTDGYAVGDKNILPKRAVLTDDCPRHDMAEVPDFGTGTDLRTGIHISRFVDEIFHQGSPYQQGMESGRGSHDIRMPNVVDQFN